MIVSGFSFGDEHINNLIFGALENRPRTHVYALQFDEQPDESQLIKRALQRSNLIICGPKTGVIGGRRAAWSPVESPAFMDMAFELEPKPRTGTGGNGEESEEKVGVMKIGDFHAFCDFLESMTAG